MKNRLFIGNTFNNINVKIKEIIEKDESLFVLDNSCDYLSRHYKSLMDKEYEVVQINMRDLEATECFNPLMYPYELYKNGKKDEACDLVTIIAKTIFVSNSAMDPFWELSATDIFIGTVLSLFDKGNVEEINFNSVHRIISLESDKLEEYFKEYDDTSDIGILVNHVIKAPAETKGGILAVTLQKLGLYASREKFSKFISRTTFDFPCITNKKCAIFFKGYDDFTLYNDLTNVFIQELYFLLSKSENTQPYTFILDGFDILNYIDNFKEIMASSNRKKINYVLGIKTKNDFIDKYGKNILDLFEVEENSEDEVIEEVPNDEVKRPNNNLQEVKIIDLN